MAKGKCRRAVNIDKQLKGREVASRDSNGNLVAALVKTTIYYDNVALAEATAIDWGKQVSQRAGVASLIME